MKGNKIVVYLSGLICWAIAVCPALIKTNLFYYDLPSIYLKGQRIFQDLSWLKPDSTGRYFPFYWFYNGIAVQLFSNDIFGFYFIQSMTLLISVFLIIFVCYKLTGNMLYTILGLIVFFTGSPMAENIYTVGKAEHIIFLFLLILITVFIYLIKETERTNLHIGYFASLLIMLFSMFSKETSIIFVAFPITFLVVSLVTDKKGIRDIKIRKTFFFIVCCISSIILARIPLLISKDANEASYTTYNVSLKLIISNLKFYITNQIDVVILGVLLTIITAIKLIQIYRKGEEQYKLHFSLLISLLSTYWAYFLALMIWRWPLGYYFYINSGILALALPILLYVMKGTSIKKPVLVTLMSLVIATRLYGIAYNQYIASSQMSMNKTYTDALTNFISHADENSKLYVEQWPFFTEEVYQSNILLHHKFNRPDLTFDGLADLFNPGLITPEIKKLYQIESIPEDKSRTPTNRDYILIFYGEKDAYWTLRGVAPFINEGSILSNQGFDLELVDSGKSINRSLYIGLDHKVKFGDTYLGYDLYKVKGTRGLSLWTGRYADGWIAENSTLQIKNPRGEKLHFNIRSLPNNLPNTVTFYHEDKKIKEVVINKTDEVFVEINLSEINSVTDEITLDINVAETFVPKEVADSEDTRNLGVLIDLMNN